MKDDHNCDKMKTANELRKKEHETRVKIYRDFVDYAWVFQVDIDCVVIEFCPFCGEKLDA